MRSRMLLVMTLVAAVTASVLTAFVPQQSAEAADGKLFDPGYIISDENFYDGNAMSSADEVLTFLQSQVGSCGNSNCLRNYAQATPTMAAVSGRCATYPGSPSDSAAAIIYKVGVACGISQKAMIVLLQKEQGLITSSAPSAYMMSAATGMGCPDTAGCDPSYAGFFYQVYWAARQFKAYQASPTSWNHQAGRYNNIRFSPNASCGSSSVYIVNAATAGLYNYTPYQPNAAALANLYGTGDGCSAYGNRNFWRLYTDWFGSPTGASNLLRTTANPNVYLVSGSVKYLVKTEAVLASYAPLGSVGFVSQATLDKYTTAQNPASNIVRSPSGTIYLQDAGIKLPIPSCTLVADYGGQCSTTGYTQLTDAQIARFSTGPELGSVLGTSAGARYYVSAGTKREILDAESQSLFGLGTSLQVLTENAVASLSLGTPIFRSDVYMNDRDTGYYYLSAGGKRYRVADSDVDALGVLPRNGGALWGASIAKISLSGTPMAGIVSNQGATSVITRTGIAAWSGGTLNATAIPIGDSLAVSYQKLPALADGSFVMNQLSPDVYVISKGAYRKVDSWEALVALSSGKSPSIGIVTKTVTSALSSGPVALKPGGLVRTNDNPDVYLIDGLGSKIRLTSMDQATQAGLGAVSYIPSSSLSGYATAQGTFGWGVTCNGTNYVSAGGSLHAISGAAAGKYPIPFTALAATTCSSIPVGQPASTFIRTSNDRVIYQLDGASKRPVTSWDRYLQLSGGKADDFLNVSNEFAASIPTGSAA